MTPWYGIRCQWTLYNHGTGLCGFSFPPMVAQLSAANIGQRFVALLLMDTIQNAGDELQRLFHAAKHFDSGKKSHPTTHCKCSLN
jgi:hypothetical protein